VVLPHLALAAAVTFAVCRHASDKGNAGRSLSRAALNSHYLSDLKHRQERVLRIELNINPINGNHTAVNRLYWPLDNDHCPQTLSRLWLDASRWRKRLRRGLSGAWQRCNIV